MTLTDLSDEELLSRLSTLCLEGRRLLARLIVHLIEVEDRRLDLKAACKSLFDFCVRRLGLSEGAAFRRMTAAKLVRRFPQLLGSIESGVIHLSTLVLLRDHLTEGNVDELVVATSGKSKREVEELLARRAPRPDVPSKIRKLPASCSRPSRPAGPLGRVEPLAEDRYKVQLTASRELRDKLERAQALMMHRNPSGDLAVVVERALDVLLEKLEKERLAKTSRPRTRVDESAPATQSRRVPNAVRRQVFERDGEQCTFVDDEGRRCPARELLELDHAESHALGGASDAENVRVRCAAHNRLHAEQVFGREYIARRVHLRQRKSRTEPAEQTLDLVARGLVNLGFRPKDARRALDIITAQDPSAVPSLAPEDLLRRALAVLT